MNTNSEEQHQNPLKNNLKIKLNNIHNPEFQNINTYNPVQKNFFDSIGFDMNKNSNLNQKVNLLSPNKNSQNKFSTSSKDIHSGSNLLKINHQKKLQLNLLTQKMKLMILQILIEQRNMKKVHHQ